LTKLGNRTAHSITAFLSFFPFRMGKDKKVVKKQKKVENAKKYENKYTQKRKEQKPNKFALIRAEKRKEIGEKVKEKKEKLKQEKKDQKAQKVDFLH